MSRTQKLKRDLVRRLLRNPELLARNPELADGLPRRERRRDSRQRPSVPKAPHHDSAQATRRDRLRRHRSPPRDESAIVISHMPGRENVARNAREPPGPCPTTDEA